jgi:phosphoglycerol transferase MdoB-like AlkP superfamily enzyme
MASKSEGAWSVVAALRPLLYFSIALLVAVTVSRVLLVAWQWDRVSDVNMLLPVFIQGLRFDLVLLGLTMVIPVLLFPLLASTHWLLPAWRLLLRVYLPIVLLLAIFMELATPSFINQFDSRPNYLFFEYLNHPKEVTATLWAAYKFPLIFALVFITATGIVVTRWLRRLVRPITVTRVIPVLLVTPLLLVLVLAMVRSTLDHRPVNPSTVATSRDPLVNELALSSAYTALYALYEKRHESAGGFRYGQMSDADVIAEVRARTDIPAQDFISEHLPTMHFQWVQEPAGRLKNLVIIVEESLGAEFVGSMGGLDLTPNLDELASSGIWFENLYATGTRSVRGLEAIVSGFTPTPARSVVKLPKSQRNFFTLAGLLAQHGYDTSFIYGGESQFDNMRRFFVNNGFERIIDEKDYDDPVFTGSWGVSDEDLFARAHEEFSRAGDKPFFSLVFTSSNHSPFQFPDDRIELFDAEKNTVNNAVKYADYALGQFFLAARQSNYWQNTVFLVVSDHNSRVYGSELVPVERFHIPGLILGGSISPGVFAPVASQIDLAPTLLSLIGVAAEHPMIGHDLTRPEAQHAPGRAIMQFNGTQAYMLGNRVAVLQKDLPVRQFTYQDGRLVETAEYDLDLERAALAHAAWSSMAYEKSLYRLSTRGPAGQGSYSD